MGDKTKIQWADATITPIRARLTEKGAAWLHARMDRADGRGATPLAGQLGWFCTHASDGCRHCYAEKMNLWRGTGLEYLPMHLKEGRVELFLDEAHLLKPLHWRRPRRIFWNDMTDLFGEWVPDEWIDRHFALFALTPQHTHMILTKRAKRIREYLNDPGSPTRIRESAKTMGDFWTDGFPPWPLPNVLGMVSAEDQRTADERIRELLAARLAWRGVSLEPMIGEVDLRRFLHEKHCPGNGQANTAEHRIFALCECHTRTPISWVIVGGESGPGARHFDLAWAREIIAQCLAAGVACFLKQVGAHPHDVRYGRFVCLRAHGCAGRDWSASATIHDRKGGDPDEWPEDLRVREFPKMEAVRESGTAEGAEHSEAEVTG